MRLFGRRNKRLWRARVKAHAPKLPRVLLLQGMDSRGNLATLPVVAGSLPPKGLAMRTKRIGGIARQCAVTPAELFWRTKAPRHARHKAPRYDWSHRYPGNWQISQGFQGGKWLVSQLRKAPKPSKAGRP